MARRKLLLISARLLLLLLGAALLLALWLAWFLRGSLPQVEGSYDLLHLSNPVSVERDNQGIPTIHASNREDSAQALGFLHAQERFFQMDLLRRNAAGELAALVGVAALDHDKAIRKHQFRQRAKTALSHLPPEHARILEAYTQGVNGGLRALRNKPFEYLLLQAEAQAWQAADSLLVLYSMYMDLQPEWNERERSLTAMKDLLPADWYTFLTPRGGKWDSPIHGEAFSDHIRFPKQALADLQLKVSRKIAREEAALNDLELGAHGFQVGSNNWSVAGFLTEYRAGMLANDMHLGLSVPNIWYRASWFVEDSESENGRRRINGATLPGTPVMVIGSNERIAWGFTNAYGDFQDTIALVTNPERSAYKTVDGWEEFRIETESIAVKDQQPVQVQVHHTRWGPVIGEDHKGNLLALRWVAHDAEAANLNLLHMEDAKRVEEALGIAPTVGIPGQNLNVVDTRGSQGWTIIGLLPNRTGFAEQALSANHNQDWSQGRLGWKGYLPSEHYPRVFNPPGGRIWTANARVASDIFFEKIGDGGYALGARQQQIENNLYSQNLFTEKDFLAIALDDRAVFLSHWQLMLAKLLQDDANKNEASLRALRGEVENWQARASESSVGYRIVKRFRDNIIHATVGSLLRKLERDIDQADDQRRDRFWPNTVMSLVEYPVWALVTEQPAQHIPAGYQSWSSFLKAMAIKTYEDISADGQPISEQSWGKANTLSIRHPLSSALPFVSTWLDMPPVPMPGDTFMPRVQGRGFGASQRMIVAPGQEARGIFHMPAGQSAHPLSPYYKRGHDDWVEGKASAFLPGKTHWVLELRPAALHPDE